MSEKRPRRHSHLRLKNIKMMLLPTSEISKSEIVKMYKSRKEPSLTRFGLIRQMLQKGKGQLVLLSYLSLIEISVILIDYLVCTLKLIKIREIYNSFTFYSFEYLSKTFWWLFGSKFFPIPNYETVSMLTYSSLFALRV